MESLRNRTSPFYKQEEDEEGRGGEKRINESDHIEGVRSAVPPLQQRSQRRMGCTKTDGEATMGGEELKDESTEKSGAWTFRDFHSGVGSFFIRNIKLNMDSNIISVQNILCVLRILHTNEASAATKTTSTFPPVWDAVLQLKHSDPHVVPSLRFEVLEESKAGRPRTIIGAAEESLAKTMHGDKNTTEMILYMDAIRVGKVTYDVSFKPQHASSPSSSSSVKNAVDSTLRGTVCFQTHGLHLCDSHCSVVYGHSMSHETEFDPVIRIAFEEHVIERSYAQFQVANVSEQWKAHSMHSDIAMELLKKTGPTSTHYSSSHMRKLNDGKNAHVVGVLTLSLFEIIERNADYWSSLKWPTLSGVPMPQKGFSWHVIRHGTDEVGLVQLQVTFIEKLSSLPVAVPHPDSIYLYPGENHFDPEIFKTNIARVAEIASCFDGIKGMSTKIFEWESPGLTVSVYLSTAVFILCFPSAHWPIIPIAILLVTIIQNYFSRIDGTFRQRFISHAPHTKQGLFRPLAQLKVAPISATLLPSKHRIDPMVRVYYEPKEGESHLIAQTEAIHSTKTPVWGGSDHRAEKTESISRAHQAWFKDAMHHLTVYEQDAILHDVVEAWPRCNSDVVDAHAYKYPVLQQVSHYESGEQHLMPWSSNTGMIRFDIINAAPLPKDYLLGQSRCSIQELVSTESGLQTEVFTTVPLSLKGDVVGEFTYRAQLSLRDPKSAITATDRFAQNAMHKITEDETAKSTNLFEKYKQVKNTAKDIQNTIGALCNTIERIQNILRWAQPEKTFMVGIILTVGLLVLFYIPIRFILLLPLTKRFTKKFHGLPDTDGIRLLNIISSLPNNMDMQRIFYWQNKEFLAQLDHDKIQVKLQAEWAGNIWKKGEGLSGLFAGWQKLYAIVRNGRLEYWVNAKDANSGIPPKSYITFSKTIDMCTTMEKKHAPRDVYEIAIYDVEKVRDSDSSAGHRRLVALTTEKEYNLFLKTVQRCGAADH